jgi:predicted CopG family antitoxin
MPFNRSITIRVETYDALEALKKQTGPKSFESFNDVITRLLEPEKKP